MCTLEKCADEEIFKIDKKPYNSCVICMELIKETDKCILSCGHEYHASCLLENAVQSNNTCPLCRVEVCKKTPQLPDLNQRMIRTFVENGVYKQKEENIKPCIKRIMKLCNANWKTYNDDQKGEIIGEFVDLLMNFGNEMGTSISQWINDSNEQIVLPEHDDEEENSDEENEYNNMETFIETYNLQEYKSRIMNNEYLSNFDNFISTDIETLMCPPGYNSDSPPLFSRDEANHLLGIILLHFTQLLTGNDD